MTLNVTNIAVIKRDDSPMKNKTSAYFSYLCPIPLAFRMDKKDKIQLDIKNRMAKAVKSSIRVAAFIARIFLEVKTIKHNPNKLADVFKIWWEFEFLSFID